MTLKDTNMVYAVQKLVADEVKARMEANKQAHLEMLRESAEVSGARQWAVEVDGEKVASLSLSARKASIKISDRAALAEAVAQAHPDMVELSLKPWAEKALLDSVTAVTDEGAVTRDGEILPGIVETPAGEPYQSLRWVKGGKDHVVAAIREGRLSATVEAAGLAGLLEA
ncbi:hypothetical protein ACUH96_00765 [Dermabacteraceae bacterium P13077]|nr:hypothetical protein [Dermabacteraceae bacterium TAE3-ERU27]